MVQLNFLLRFVDDSLDPVEIVSNQKKNHQIKNFKI